MLGDLLRRLRPFRAEPVRGPVQCAQERTGGDGGVGGVQRPGAKTAEDKRAHATFVAVALGDDAGTQRGRKRVDFKMSGGALDLIDQTQDVGDGHLTQAHRQRPAIPARRSERVQQAVG